MIKRKLLCGLVALPIAGLLATACSSGPSSGTVIAKQYTPGHYYTYLQPIPHTICTDVEGANNTMTEECNTTYTYIPEQLWAGPDWKLELQSGQSKGWVDVSQTVYKHYAKGDFYGKKSAQ